jgi:uncharacterized protein
MRRWKLLRLISPGAALRRCAISFPIWKKAASGPIRPPSRTSPCVPRLPKPGDAAPRLRLFAGGRSFGGRMTSQAQASAPLAGVDGLAFFGFPLHPAGKPSIDRAKHLADIKIPMLFMQGSNDKLAELALLEPVVKRLGALASLHLVKDADHSFHVPARSGRTDREVLNEILDAFAAWIGALKA